MRNLKPATKIKKAKEKMDSFSSKDSVCPICKASFRRGCDHSIKQAKDKLFENYVRAIAADS